MYAANAERKRLRSAFSDMETYLKSLAMELYIKRADKSKLQRIAQMTQKTNQFNLTTKRYTELEIDEMLSDSTIRMYIGSVRDKFGDNGITNLCILKINGKTASIDSFLMSCRVMERKIEYDFLRCIENDLHADGVQKMFATFIPTQKNIPSSDFLSTYGFEKDTSVENSYLKEVENRTYSGLLNVIGI